MGALIQRARAAEGAAGQRPNLDVGDTGPAVRLLQRRLNGQGAQLRVDGVFGPRTHTAVVAFQRTHPELLPATGGVGERTWAELDGPSSGTPTCHYEPGEKEASQKSPGGVQVISDREFVLTDFTPGQAALKSAHQEFLKKFAADHQLDNPFNDDSVLAIGSTDCVSEDTAPNSDLRFARASAVTKLLFFLNANKVSAVVDPTARITESQGPLGRAQARSVRVRLGKETPESSPEPEKKEVPPGMRPMPPVRTFLVRVTGGISGGEGIVGGVLKLRVQDVDQGLEADFTYTSLGTGASPLPFNIPEAGKYQPVKVDTATVGHQVTLEDFAGPASSTGAGGGPSTKTYLDVGRGFGTIELDGASLVPGVGLDVGVIQLGGGGIGRSSGDQAEPAGGGDGA